MGAISGAALIIPAAWPLVETIFKGQCDPAAMYRAGQTWHEAGDKLGEAINAVNDITNSTAVQGWEGADRDAFLARMADFVSQLNGAKLLAYTVGIAMCIAAVYSALFIAVLAAIAVVLAGFAVAITAATASIVGNAGLSEELMAQANAFAGGSIEVTKGIDASKNATDIVLTAGIVGVMAGDVITQVSEGNPGVVKDLVKSQVDSVPAIVGGMASLGARDVLADWAGAYPDHALRTGFNDVSAAVADVFAGGGTPWDPILDQNDDILDPPWK
jgi:hypothetical protein